MSVSESVPAGHSQFYSLLPFIFPLRFPSSSTSWACATDPPTGRPPSGETVSRKMVCMHLRRQSYDHGRPALRASSSFLPRGGISDSPGLLRNSNSGELQSRHGGVCSAAAVTMLGYGAQWISISCFAGVRMTLCVRLPPSAFWLTCPPRAFRDSLRTCQSLSVNDVSRGRR